MARQGMLETSYTGYVETAYEEAKDDISRVAELDIHLGPDSRRNRRGAGRGAGHARGKLDHGAGLRNPRRRHAHDQLWRAPKGPAHRRSRRPLQHADFQSRTPA